MSRPEDAGDHEAVIRLYELTRDGETGCGEYAQLDQLVYRSLIRTYGTEDDGPRQAVAA